MFRFGVLVGFGVGYVLGTKAGRDRYYELVRLYERMAGDERFQRAMEKGKAVVDLSTERARSAVSEGINSASRRVRRDDGEAPIAG